MATWIVRGGSRWGDAEHEFLTSGSVGIYFGADQNISRMSEDDLRLEVAEFYVGLLAEKVGLVEPSRVKRVVTYYLNQLIRFRDDIALADTIVMPLKAFNGHRVARGVVVGEYEDWGLVPYRHRRRVDWADKELHRDKVGYVWTPSDRRTVFRIDG